jgi:hypothetical protein
VIVFGSEGVADQEYVPPIHVANHHYYWEVLRHLKEQVCQKCPQLWWNHDWLVKHDSVPANSALSVRPGLATVSMAAVFHPHSTSDLAPFDLFFFPRMKSHLHLRHFYDVPEIQEHLLIIIRTISKNKFQRCFSSARNFDPLHKLLGGKWWCSWLRHCATSQKAAGLIPNGVIGIFH